jgi:uncharacterized protein YecE (DUF72 family)
MEETEVDSGMSVARSLAERLEAVDAFNFTEVHPRVRFGTASDRYAGWIGQIYGEMWATRTKSRRKVLDGRSFKENVVPTESVREYFEHFSILEMDFTFYRPLREADGELSSNYRVIERYLDHAPEHARFLVKAPQMFCSPFLRGVGPNVDYLNADAYMIRFQEPLLELLGPRLAGVLFEQGYQSVKNSPTDDILVDHLDTFFNEIGSGPQVHLEVRSPHLLTPLYFDWLETKGLGHVFSHWTWLPSIQSQWKNLGRVTSADSNVVLRLLTPRKMKYADAYALAHPFDKVVPKLSEAYGAREMIDESVALAFQAVDSGGTIDVISNNRAWGNAPELAAEIARGLLDFEQRRRQV